jgi:hypothetical protein
MTAVATVTPFKVIEPEKYPTKPKDNLEIVILKNGSNKSYLIEYDNTLAYKVEIDSKEYSIMPKDVFLFKTFLKRRTLNFLRMFEKFGKVRRFYICFLKESEKESEKVVTIESNAMKEGSLSARDLFVVLTSTSIKKGIKNLFVKPRTFNFSLKTVFIIGIVFVVIVIVVFLIQSGAINIGEFGH